MSKVIIVYLLYRCCITGQHPFAGQNGFTPPPPPPPNTYSQVTSMHAIFLHEAESSICAFQFLLLVLGMKGATLDY